MAWATARRAESRGLLKADQVEGITEALALTDDDPDGPHDGGPGAKGGH
jgi:hypothetical protein